MGRRPLLVAKCKALYLLAGTGAEQQGLRRQNALVRTRGSGGRAAALLRLAAVTVGRTDTALGSFYRRLSSRIGKARAVTATARKIAVLFYNALRYGRTMSIQGPRPTRRVTQREWSTIRMGVPRHWPLFSNPWSRKSVLPFLRNHSPASTPRSWHLVTSHRPRAQPSPSSPRRTRQKPRPQAELSRPSPDGVDVEVLGQLACRPVG